MIGYEHPSFLDIVFCILRLKGMEARKGRWVCRMIGQSIQCRSTCGIVFVSVHIPQLLYCCQHPHFFLFIAVIPFHSHIYCTHQHSHHLVLRYILSPSSHSLNDWFLTVRLLVSFRVSCHFLHCHPSSPLCCSVPCLPSHSRINISSSHVA